MLYDCIHKWSYAWRALFSMGPFPGWPQRPAAASARGRSSERPLGSGLQPAEYAVWEPQQVIAAKTQMDLPVRRLPLTAVCDDLHGHQYAP